MHRIAGPVVTASTMLSVVALLGSAGCAGGTADRTVLVLAASSLTDAFTSMETAFEAGHPDVDVQLSFGGSSTLRVQVEQGAPADVIALADLAPMTALDAAGLVTDPAPFASNSIVLAVPADNPGDVMSLADLADDDLLVGVCAPEVPCGAYARAVFDAAGVTPSLDTEEPDVRSLAAKVASGELDAGLVYATDLDAFPGELTAIALPDGVDVRADYPIAVVGDGDDDARRFVEFVFSPPGRTILTDAGFGDV